MISTLNILQANLYRSSGVQDALYNDPDVWDFDAILIQEPHYWEMAGHLHVTGAGPNFEVIKPKTLQRENQAQRVRSCMWINSKAEYTQITVNSNDITAVILKQGTRSILVVSIYIPNIGNGHEPDEQELHSRLQQVQEAITGERNDNPELEVFIAGDFNRHDTIWGGNEVATEQRQGEGSRILDFIEENNLQLLTQRGVATWERNGSASTIDLTMVSERLFYDRNTCQLFENEYGSDHRAIHTAIGMGEVIEDPAAPRYMLQKADWKAIRSRIEQQLINNPFPTNDLEAMQGYIQDVTQTAIDHHCPKAKPSKYAKRWWANDLTSMRKDYTRARNLARSRRRQGRRDECLEIAAKIARQDFHHAIRKRKKEHWTEFLGESTNIWKAAQYLDPDKRSSFGRITSIKGHEGEIIQDKARIAKELLHSFFPEPPIPQRSEQARNDGAEQILSEKLTVDEIEKALFSASPDKAAGSDGLTIRVWKEVWPVLQQQIHTLFTTSLRLGKLPMQWKVAKIVPLKKGNKDDYTLPKNYRPISLLATLGKVMEAVMATRIAYLTEVHKLLPNNHFGARKQKSTVLAISYLQETIYDAWRGKKTLSLVSFDVKGAYNNVATGPLLERLRQRRIPEIMVKWIQDFCTDRKASVVVNGFTSEVEDLPQSGLPQGSPLAPILFLFFNADLVQMAIREGASMAFVDDYTAWVVSNSAERNTRIIQREILPKLERWERESGAVFEASKTAFIHFTRYSDLLRDSDMPLCFKGDQIRPSQSIKVLGVILDQGLRFKEHLADKAEKALKAALALKRLQGLNPSTMRQLYTATVAPVMDYASPVWYLAVSNKTLATLHRAQRVAAQAIVGGFRTMGLDVAVLEAGIPSLQQRLHEQTLRFWISIQKLEDSHIHARLAKTKPIRRFNSPLRKAAGLFKELNANRSEKIPAVGCEPWSPKAHVHILDKDTAKLATEEQPATIDFYTDGSVRNGRAGVGIWTSAWEVSRTIRRAEEINVHLTELEAIWMAIKSLSHEHNRLVKIRVFTDSQSALRSIQSAKINDSLGLVKKIREKIAKATFSLHWVPGHEGIKGNERANELAQKATEVDSPIPDPANSVPISAIYARAKVMDFKPKRKEFYGATTGKHLQKIDKALPGKHTNKLYNALNKRSAAILVQMRTNISRLNTYLSKINVADTDRCECGMKETVQHFLFLCPKWRNERQNMKSAHGSRYWDVSYALGGYSTVERDGKRIDGEKDKWQPDLNAVKATIDYATKTGRLQRQI
jgi:ribonuclease HI